MGRRIILSLLLALGAICCLAGNLGAAPRYQVHRLGFLPGARTTFANNLNDLGQVVGYAEFDPGVFRAFIWTPENGMEDLGDFGGQETVAKAINNLGQVVGYSDINAVKYRAFLWTREGGLQDLGSLDGGTSAAYDINDQSQVTGHSSNAPDLESGFLWSPDHGLQSLGTFGGRGCFPQAINNQGEIAGYYYPPPPSVDYAHAFFWSPKSGFRDLGTLGDPSLPQDSQGLGVNDQGQVVGITTLGSDNATEHAYRWTKDDGMKLLNDPPWPKEQSWAYGINNRGEIVGVSNTPVYPIGASSLWSPTLGRLRIEDYVSPPMTDFLIVKINEHGAMVGVDLRRQEAILLTPITAPAFPPSLYLLLLLGPVQ
jgi:probable HAF family extracellular repeat protein